MTLTRALGRRCPLEVEAVFLLSPSAPLDTSLLQREVHSLCWVVFASEIDHICLELKIRQSAVQLNERSWEAGFEEATQD